MQTIQVMKCYFVEGTEVKSVKLQKQKLKPTNQQTLFLPFLLTPLLSKFGYIHRLQPGPTSCQCLSSHCSHIEKMRIYFSFYSAFLLWKKPYIFIKSHIAS